MSFISDLITNLSAFRIKIGEKLNTLNSRLGNLLSLTTTNKTNLVGAVNEVNEKASVNHTLQSVTDNDNTTTNGIFASRFRWNGSTTTPVGVVSTESGFYNLGPTYGYGISTNTNGGLDIMANQTGQPIRFWSGGDNVNPIHTASFNGLNVSFYGSIDVLENIITQNYGTSNDWKDIKTKFLGFGSAQISPGNTIQSLRREDATDGNYSYSPILHLGGGDTAWQLQANYSSDRIQFRGGYNANYRNWVDIIHANNIETYINRKVWAISDIEGDGSHDLDLFNKQTYAGCISANDGNWWSVFNIQHRNGLPGNSNDGDKWGTQFRVGMVSGRDDFQFRGLNNGVYDSWKTIWHDGNFNPGDKVNNWDVATAIGFLGSDASKPYFHHSTSGSFVELATVNNHTHNFLTNWGDTRTTPTIPDNYNNKFEPKGIKNASFYGVGTNYVSVFGYRGWSDASGGEAIEFVVPDYANDLYFRKGGSTSWGILNKIWHSGNLDPSTLGGSFKLSTDKTDDLPTTNGSPVSLVTHVYDGLPQAQIGTPGNALFEVVDEKVVKLYSSYDQVYTQVESVSGFDFYPENIRAHIYNIIFQGTGNKTLSFADGVYAGDQLNITVYPGTSLDIAYMNGSIISSAPITAGNMIKVKSFANLIWDADQGAWVLTSYGNA